METKRILITGANGYLGARLSTYFAQKGHKVYGLVYPEVPPIPNFSDLFEKLLVGDIRQQATIDELTSWPIDVLIHLVSLDHHQSNGDIAMVNAINVLPLWQLLDAFKHKGLSQCIYFSTIHVYGQIPLEVITESHTPAPMNAYGLTHLLSEEVCRLYHRTSPIQCTTVRLSNSYGAPIIPDKNCWTLVINDLCRQAIEKKEIHLQSDGSPQRDFIHGNDVCKAIEQLIGHQQAQEIFHISSGQTYTIEELAELVQHSYEQRFGIRIPITKKTNNSPIARSKYIISNKAISDMGFTPTVSLQLGIHELFDSL